MKRSIAISGKIEPFFGTLDETSALLEDRSRPHTLQDVKLTIEGTHESVDRAVKIVEEYNQATRQRPPSLRRGSQKPDAHRSRRSRKPRQRNLRTRQAALFRQKNKSLRKTHAKALHGADRSTRHGLWHRPGRHRQNLSRRAMARQRASHEQVNRIILGAPAVEAGEKLGFLRARSREKKLILTCVRFLRRALRNARRDKLESFIERESSEIAPLAFMRGRHAQRLFVILDEAQNTTSEQMKMFLTAASASTPKPSSPRRNADRFALRQTKRPHRSPRNLRGKIEGIGCTQFSRKDVVRHIFVQRIHSRLRGYEAGHPHARTA